MSNSSNSDSFFSSSEAKPTQTDNTQNAVDETTDSAIVYCEGLFGEKGGEYATRLLQHSEKYRVISVIDSRYAGSDTGIVLGEDPHGITLRKDLKEALAQIDIIPGALILAAAPTNSDTERQAILSAIENKLNIINAWTPYLSDDEEYVAASEAQGVNLVDLSKPVADAKFVSFTGEIAQVTCPIVAVLGTDTQNGQRDTAIGITRGLNNVGVRTIMVSTGHEGLTQGARYGLVLESIPAEFKEGELEATILRAFKEENPEMIIVEGQGAIGHQEDDTAETILRGAQPGGVVIQHAPKRRQRISNPDLNIPPLSGSVKYTEAFTEENKDQKDIKVIGITLNSENMTNPQLDAAVVWLESNLERPVVEPLTHPTSQLVSMVAGGFPKIKRKLENTAEPEADS